MKITAKLLRKHNVCEDQLKLFEQTFPEGASVTLANARKALAVGLNLEWAIENLFGASAKTIYDAKVAYDAAAQSASDAYYAAAQSASDAYYAAVRAASDTYCGALCRAFVRVAKEK